MALTKDLITAQESLKDLSDDQISALETLSSNDEQTSIQASVNDLQANYLSTRKDLTGAEIPANAQFGEQFKTVVGGLVTTAKKAENVGALETKIKDLEKQIADGSTDDALKQQLQDAQDALSKQKDAYSDLEAKFKTQGDEHAQQLNGFRVNTAYSAATAQIKFKPEFDKVKDGLLNAANTSILAKYTPSFVKDLKDNDVLVFRDSDNKVATNPNNKMEPFTYQELLAAEVKDYLQATKSTGAGTDPQNPGGDGTVLDLSGAKTREQADQLLEKHVLALGHRRGTPKFQTVLAKLRADNKVSDLPIS